MHCARRLAFYACFWEFGFDEYPACLLVACVAIELSKGIDGLHVEYIDIAPLPMLNTDLEGEGTFPPAVEAFRQQIKAADSILFASPEYNYSVTGTPFLFRYFQNPLNMLILLIKCYWICKICGYYIDKLGNSIKI
jgi:hypothetical protein